MAHYHPPPKKDAWDKLMTILDVALPVVQMYYGNKMYQQARGDEAAQKYLDRKHELADQQTARSDWMRQQNMQAARDVVHEGVELDPSVLPGYRAPSRSWSGPSENLESDLSPARATVRDMGYSPNMAGGIRGLESDGPSGPMGVNPYLMNLRAPGYADKPTEDELLQRRVDRLRGEEVPPGMYLNPSDATFQELPFASEDRAYNNSMKLLGAETAAEREAYKYALGNLPEGAKLQGFGDARFYYPDPPAEQGGAGGGGGASALGAEAWRLADEISSRAGMYMPADDTVGQILNSNRQEGPAIVENMRREAYERAYEEVHKELGIPTEAQRKAMGFAMEMMNGDPDALAMYAELGELEADLKADIDSFLLSGGVSPVELLRASGVGMQGLSGAGFWGGNIPDEWMGR